MDFAATALFTVLLIEQWLKVRKPLPFVVAFVSSCIALILFFQHMLLAAIVLSITTIIILRFIKSKQNDWYKLFIISNASDDSRNLRDKVDTFRTF